MRRRSSRPRGALYFGLRARELVVHDGEVRASFRFFPKQAGRREHQQPESEVRRHQQQRRSSATNETPIATPIASASRLTHNAP